MNPRLKCIARFPSMEREANSSFHVCDRSLPSRNGSPTSSEASTIEDEAALLLSISSICDREVKDKGFDALFDEMPRFPSLGVHTGPGDLSPLKPRPEAQHQNSGFQALRARSVSIDSPSLASTWVDRITSPVSLPASETMNPGPVLVSPLTPHSTVRRLPARKQSLRLAKQTRREPVSKVAEKHRESSSVVSAKSSKGRTLQSSPPKGVPIKKIGRKKFSWKCYPELEQFLITNREEYLRHSALNYTVQQKQYNNRLTDELLELATRHGYIFDTQEFSFVTVRDRIRCYYKSYVQSAKKRGVLMGYAARKAGLLKDDKISIGAETVTSL
ncbi:hypothetical protein ACA910_011309 [Epithemia clementina (nom. ined.)]